MPKISAEDKENATVLPLERYLSNEDDTEKAFNDFRASFDTGEEPGTVRAWKLDIDERGNIGTRKQQVKLGSWPVDAYSLDELSKMLIEQFVKPGEDMAVRLVGTKPDQPGYIFNKILLLKAPFKKESSSDTKESTSSLLKMMQENNERIIAMVQRMQASPQEKPDTMGELQKMMVFAQAMNAPMMTMLQSLLPALAGRPQPAAASDPFQSVGSLLDVAERLSDMRGGGGGGGSGGDDNSFAGILRAITPLAKPALEALPAIAAMQAARPKPAMIQAPRPVNAAPSPSTPTNGAGGTAAPAPAGGGNSAPAMQPTDVPSGDSAMLAQLKPQIDSLVQMAQQGSDATGAADLVFDQVFMDERVTEDLFEKLANFVDSDSFVNYVGIMNPAAKEHTAWFEAFKVQIVKRLTEEDSAAVSTPTGQPLAKIN